MNDFIRKHQEFIHEVKTFLATIPDPPNESWSDSFIEEMTDYHNHLKHGHEFNWDNTCDNCGITSLQYYFTQPKPTC